MPDASPAAAFAARCAAGELAYQVAPDGRAVFPPRLAEPGTGAPLRWETSRGEGTVYATTVVRRRGAEPHNIALIDVDEGFRMMSSVVDCAPDDVRIGMRVAVRFTDEHVPVFAPA
jgi:uncharacterized OB-fold protein